MLPFLTAGFQRGLAVLRWALPTTLRRLVVGSTERVRADLERDSPPTQEKLRMNEWQSGRRQSARRAALRLLQNLRDDTLIEAAEPAVDIPSQHPVARAVASAQNPSPVADRLAQSGLRLPPATMLIPPTPATRADAAE